MRRTKWAAMAVAVIVLGAAGCGTSDAGTGVAAAPVPTSPRPQGTGPLTKEVVRTDLDTSAAAAGVPANASEYARVPEDASAGSPRSCVVGFKGFGTEATPVDVARYEAVVGELRKRDWQQPRDRKERKGVDDGVIYEAQVVLKQRGWTMVAEYRTAPEDGVITLMAFEDVCMKKNGADAGPVG
ncbi:hypothetical protein J7E93_28095 [Streptomyces sp. ISL-36]|uniref:hypothetical protein n=1 Tax=Streptomyces sp. ISL-36 TaxID=2819182 RepID=UPI001BEC24EA|nr:hypothetical protein [Streptomyces sp. ISL-36]MBT2443889.1 hypothetical protein [Streptomyces sp. ISL-36]